MPNKKTPPEQLLSSSEVFLVFSIKLGVNPTNSFVGFTPSPFLLIYLVFDIELLISYPYHKLLNVRSYTIYL